MQRHRTAALSRRALADAPKLQETDSTAQAFGYKTDAAKVDKAKYARYAAGQDCSNCTFYQGKPTDAFAPCPIVWRAAWPALLSLAACVPIYLPPHPMFRTATGVRPGKPACAHEPTRLPVGGKLRDVGS
ncbi:high-potential iron-sulfur protein [Mycetohabitans sp. B46]